MIQIVAKLTLPLLVSMAMAQPGVQLPADLARPALQSQSTGNGLPNETVHDFILGHQGRLWAATMEGPAWFNGQSWEPFPLPGGGASAFVRTLLETPDGSLWFGTESDGLWQHKQGGFTHHWTGNGFLPKRVNHLLGVQGKDGQTELWAGTNEGVARFTGGTWRLMGRESGLSDPMVWKLREVTDRDGKRRLWAATARGLCRWTGTAWQAIDQKEGFPGTHANDILEVDEGGGRRSIWVGSWGLGLVRWDGTRWQVHGPKEGFSSLNPTTLAVTRHPNGRTLIWAGTYEAGVLWFDGRQWRHLTPEKGFPSVGTLGMLANPGGKPSLWVGSRGAGVVSLDMSGWRTLDRDQGLPNPEVTCFAGEASPEPGRERFWIGTRRGLVTWQGGRPKVASGLPSDYLISLLHSRPEGGPSRLWATTLKGLMLQEDGKPWQLMGAKEGFPPGLANALAEVPGPQGTATLWVGLDRGVAHLDQGRWQVSTAAEGFPSTAVVALGVTQDPDGSSSLWMGTREGDIRRHKSGMIQSFGRASGFPPFTPTSFHASRTPDGRRWLWVGTIGGGIGCLELDRPDARWTTFSPEALPGLPSGIINRIAEDRKGRLYLATPAGVVRVTLDASGPALKPKGLETFTLGDGLPSLNCLAVLSDHQGLIWVGTSKGAAVLDPAQEQFPPPPPPPFIERAELIGRGLQVLSGQRLGHRDNHLAFRFALPVFHRREDMAYRSQLVGLEATPSDWRGNPVREFAALPPGRYTMQVWARDYRGLVSEPTTFSFTVARPPWGTPWAYGLYLLALGATFFGLTKWRIRILNRRNQHLEDQVSARTQELEVANRELNSALEEVQVLQGIIPICAYCKKIRDEAGYWDQVESYISAHTNANFSHGICPECVMEHFPPVPKAPGGE